MFLALGARPRLVLLLLPLGEAEEALQRTTQDAVLTGVRLVADFAGALVSEPDITTKWPARAGCHLEERSCQIQIPVHTTRATSICTCTCTCRLRCHWQLQLLI